MSPLFLAGPLVVALFVTPSRLSQLPYSTFDSRTHTITTRERGPRNPSRVTYAVERGGALREIASCRFLNPIDARVGTLVRMKNGHTTYTEARLAPGEQDPCAY
jgi:hypothetical protein